MTIDIEMKLIKQIFERNKLENIEQNIKKELSNLNIGKKIKPGMRIGITAGSRGIDRINLILKTISDEIKKYEGIPVVIIEENIGAPIIATDKSFVIGYLENGLPVYVNDLVKSLDAILVVNRIKVHTSFKAPIESGLNKMTAIGLGHHKGASLIHSLGIENLHRNILRFSNRILKELPIIGGIGLL